MIEQNDPNGTKRAGGVWIVAAVNGTSPSPQPERYLIRSVRVTHNSEITKG